MANIEMHGFGDLSFHIQQTIQQILKGEFYEKDCVITTYDDTVVDTKGMPQSFIRLVSTPHDYVQGLIAKLQALSLDIEYLELKEFIPGK